MSQLNNSTIGGVVMLIVGFAMGHMSAELFQINAWLLSAFVAGLGLALGYVGVLGLRLTGEERERARLRRIFGRYVAPEVVKKLLAEGTIPNLGGEASQVTVLFSDIRNFTTIAESLAPGQVVEILNTYFSRAIEPILAAGGTVDKFLGDGVMAYFNAPLPQPDHALRAVRAAWRVCRAVEESHGELPPASRLSFGVGVSTGQVVIGNIGTPQLMNFTAIGDAVNVSLRLQEHARLEESGGLFEGILELMPHCKQQISRLVKQHNDLIDILEMACIHLRQGDATEAEALHDDLKSFLDSVRRHEQEEGKLLRRAIKLSPNAA